MLGCLENSDGDEMIPWVLTLLGDEDSVMGVEELFKYLLEIYEIWKELIDHDWDNWWVSLPLSLPWLFKKIDAILSRGE